jgi:hypothetical protein
MKARTLLALALAAGWPAAESRAAGSRAGGSAWCGTSRHGGRDSVWAHREQRERGESRARAAEAASADVGDIAVLVDAGDLALVRNAMDLQRSALRFSPTRDGYAVSRMDLPLEADAGTRLSLADDASVRVPLGFSFPFYGRSHSEMFVNSDGNVTFGEKDDASTERNVGRLVNGPPRAAPMLTDLNPETRGTVSVLALADHVTVTWQSVPQFGRLDQNTFQVALWRDGRVDFVYDQAVSATIDEGVVGVAPGGARGGLTAVDFARAAEVAGGAGALAETFRARTNLDAVAVARRFYATHPDDYRQLVVFTSQTLTPAGAFAYSLSVRNADAGIGLEGQDLSAEYGSGGRLESFVMMDALTKYPDDLGLRFLGEDSALSVLAHEVGHRWLANAAFRDGNAASREVLGRDGVHWSFFLDTDGSFLEGNDIQPQADGTFRTVGASLRYSALDQYLMGLRSEGEVPPFFLVRSPTGTSHNPARKPESGVTFTGTRKDVAIGDVVAALGRRDPPGAPWPAPLRQAFVYVAVGGEADAAALQKLERIRAAWPAFFRDAVEQRGSVDPSLD